MLVVSFAGHEAVVVAGVEAVVVVGGEAESVAAVVVATVVSFVASHVGFGSTAGEHTSAEQHSLPKNVVLKLHRLRQTLIEVALVALIECDLPTPGTAEFALVSVVAAL